MLVSKALAEPLRFSPTAGFESPDDRSMWAKLALGQSSPPVEYTRVSRVAKPPCGEVGTYISMREDGIMRNEVAQMGWAEFPGIEKLQEAGTNLPPAARRALVIQRCY